MYCTTQQGSKEIIIMGIHIKKNGTKNMDCIVNKLTLFEGDNIVKLSQMSVFGRIF